MENTVMFQKSHYIQEQGDLAQTLRCVWQKEIRKPLSATLPFRRKHAQKIVRAETELTTENKATESSYSENTSTKQPSPVRRFQGKGQVESISFGRRRGKSMDNSYKFVDAQESSRLNLPNLTALAFKADESSGAHAVVSFTRSLICNSALLVSTANIFFSYLIRD
ncbi:unnamed protein product [Orchesella dallaii]|uniref:Uncharacterized protein n=1 Tax=Orchesella dallaii TaxID=48710 RepID=A0ABP1Q1Z0_9HEXA